MKIHRVLSSLQNGLTKRSSSYTIWFQMRCWIPFLWKCLYQVRAITVFPVFRLLTDFVCLLTYEFLKDCSVFDNFVTNKQKSEIEEVQRRAARYTTGRFHNTSSVTSMLDHLEWNSIETRRNIAKVTMLYKIEETEFEIVSGCAEGFVSKTMAVSCEWCLRRDIEIWIDGNQIVRNFV
jgi:hypothetical protein